MQMLYPVCYFPHVRTNSINLSEFCQNGFLKNRFLDILCFTSNYLNIMKIVIYNQESKMSTDYVYMGLDESLLDNELVRDIRSKIKGYSDDLQEFVYIIDSPLIDDKYSYNYTEKLIILIPNHKVLLLNLSNSIEEFEEFVEDFIEDLGSISDKFDYKTVIGRSRKWRDELIYTRNISDVNDIIKELKQIKFSDSGSKRKANLIISLLTGSINDIARVRSFEEPVSILDKIKQKIILFDSDQTRFIYESNEGKRVTIQGLSGTGKTELLLHKLKELYTKSSNTKIMFTCHNVILADSLRQRIPDFFNFMRVEEQIEWNKRLWCVRAWGSYNDINSGAFRLICHHYNISFHSYSRLKSFGTLCKEALEEINKISDDEFEYLFDYMLVDESQDFAKDFFDLCEKVTKEKIYIAGDIFQNIFDHGDLSVQPDYLLNKCYRTDPRTLMFAHGLGMGLFESQRLNWLKDDEWSSCGYLIEKTGPNNEKYKFTREPIKRFEELQDDIDSIGLIDFDPFENYVIQEKIIDIITDLKSSNPTIQPEDIAIIFTGSGNEMYSLADSLEYALYDAFEYEVNKAYESKKSKNNTLLISNKNNIKGLEFPFVICIANKLDVANYMYRNALYMMLTRSFIKSYLLVSSENNKNILPLLRRGISQINNENAMTIVAPTELERKKIEENRVKILYRKKMTQRELVFEISDELGIPYKFRDIIYRSIKSLLPSVYDYDRLENAILNTYKIMEN